MTAKLFLLPVGRSVLFTNLVKYLDLDVELVYVNKTDSGYDNKEFIDNFPLKKFPSYLETSSDGDVFTLTEMTAIANYLIEKAISEKIPKVDKAVQLGYGSKDTTTDYKTHNDILRWLSFVTSEYIPQTADVMLITFGVKEKDDELAEKSSKNSLEYFAKFAGKTLKHQKFLADPDVPTLADFAAAIPFFYSLNFGLTDEYKSKHPEIVAWAKEVFSSDFVADSFKDVSL